MSKLQHITAFHVQHYHSSQSEAFVFPLGASLAHFLRLRLLPSRQTGDRRSAPNVYPCCYALNFIDVTLMDKLDAPVQLLWCFCCCCLCPLRIQPRCLFVLWRWNSAFEADKEDCTNACLLYNQRHRFMQVCFFFFPSAFVSIWGTYFTSHAGLRLTALCGCRPAALRVSPATTAGLQEFDVAPLAPPLHSPFFLRSFPSFINRPAASEVSFCSWGDGVRFCTCMHGCTHASVCKSSKEPCAVGNAFSHMQQTGQGPRWTQVL